MEPARFVAEEHRRLAAEAHDAEAARGNARLALLARFIIDREIHRRVMEDVVIGATTDRDRLGAAGRCPVERAERRWLRNHAGDAGAGDRLHERRRNAESEYLGT